MDAMTVVVAALGVAGIYSYGKFQFYRGSLVGLTQGMGICKKHHHALWDEKTKELHDEMVAQYGS